MIISSKEKINPLRNELGWILIGIVFLSMTVNILQVVISICLKWRRIKKLRDNAVVRIRPIIPINIPINISNITRLEVIQEEQEEESKESGSI